jgi:hypothetical protein
MQGMQCQHTECGVWVWVGEIVRRCRLQVQQVHWPSTCMMHVKPCGAQAGRGVAVLHRWVWTHPTMAHTLLQQQGAARAVAAAVAARPAAPAGEAVSH